jgi:translation initiation factor IF-2
VPKAKGASGGGFVNPVQAGKPEKRKSMFRRKAEPTLMQPTETRARGPKPGAKPNAPKPGAQPGGAGAAAATSNGQPAVKPTDGGTRGPAASGAAGGAAGGAAKSSGGANGAGEASAAKPAPRNQAWPRRHQVREERYPEEGPNQQEG